MGDGVLVYLACSSSDSACEQAIANRARGAELAEGLPLTGSDRYSSVARTRANGDLYTPALRDRWEAVYFPGIRAAGLPEE